MQKENFSGAHAAEDVPVLLRLSNVLRAIVDFVGRWASWFLVPLVLVTVVDVVARKLTFHAADGTVYGLQIWLKENVSRYFESTLLQELEWHLHTVLFALVLGFGTIYNTHVRVDLVRDNVGFRKKIWIEFLGLTCFMIPYLLLVIWFASSWVFESYKVGEISASTVGLSHRWMIKGILVAGLLRRHARRHRGLAAGCGPHVGRQIEALPADDARMAGGGRQQDRRQGAHQAR